MIATIGKCVVEDFGDVGAFMIKSKLCGRCPRYDKEEIYLGIAKLNWNVCWQDAKLL